GRSAAGPRTSGRGRARGGTSSPAEYPPSRNDRAWFDDWNGTLSGQRDFRKAGGPRGGRKLLDRSHCCPAGDVGAGGDVGGASRGRSFRCACGNVSAPVGGLRGSLHVLVLPRYYR